jgi:hypothetical protein
MTQESATQILVFAILSQAKSRGERAALASYIGKHTSWPEMLLQSEEDFRAHCLRCRAFSDHYGPPAHYGSLGQGRSGELCPYAS